MARPKGQPKLGGRVKGVPNKMTHSIRDMLAAFVSEKVQELPTLWDRLEDKEKIDCLAKMMPYVAPKLESVSLNGGENTDIQIRISKTK